MKIGVAIDFHGKGDFPNWKSIREQALLAEEMGFDVVVIPDHLIYHQEDGDNVGAWESVSMAGALVEATDTISIGHSMFNAPYRSPALVAKIAETLDEISGGRYIFGLGAGNTPDADYAAFGVSSGNRYSRFEEAIRIIHPLLKEGRVDFQGSHWSAEDAEMVLRGPRSGGPPIMIAAHGPKMMRLAAQYADGWNGWVIEPSFEVFREMTKELEIACEEFGRDPATLRRTLDVNIDHLDMYDEVRPGGPMKPLSGSDEEIAEEILSYRELDIDEVRIYSYKHDNPQAHLEAIKAMDSIRKLVQAG